MPQPPLPTLGRELTPSSPAHSPPLPSSLEILQENSSGLALSPLSQFLEEAPQNSQCLQWMGDKLEPRARLIPWDSLCPDWGGTPFQKGNRFCRTWRKIQPVTWVCSFWCLMPNTCMFTPGRWSDIPARVTQTGRLGHLSSKETPEYCLGQSLPNIGPRSVCCPLLGSVLRDRRGWTMVRCSSCCWVLQWERQVGPPACCSLPTTFRTRTTACDQGGALVPMLPRVGGWAVSTQASVWPFQRLGSEFSFKLSPLLILIGAIASEVTPRPKMVCGVVLCTY